MMLSAASAIETRRPEPPRPSGKTLVVHETITLNRRNATYDYEGATLIWKGAGDCSQKENMPPIFHINGRGVTLKNATIIGAPDGIHISAVGVRIENISFPDVCEDAITMKAGARWARVSHCYFARAADKAIQCTYGYGHHVFENTFVDVKCAFRSKPGVNASFYRNRLYHCGSACPRRWPWIQFQDLGEYVHLRQAPLPGARPCDHPPARRRPEGGVSHTLSVRDRKRERRPLSRLGLHPHLPLVPLDDPLAQG